MESEEIAAQLIATMHQRTAALLAEGMRRTAAETEKHREMRREYELAQRQVVSLQASLRRKARRLRRAEGELSQYKVTVLHNQEAADRPPWPSNDPLVAKLQSLLEASKSELTEFKTEAAAKLALSKSMLNDMLEKIRLLEEERVKLKSAISKPIDTVDTSHQPQPPIIPKLNGHTSSDSTEIEEEGSCTDSGDITESNGTRGASTGEDQLELENCREEHSANGEERSAEHSEEHSEEHSAEHSAEHSEEHSEEHSANGEERSANGEESSRNGSKECVLISEHELSELRKDLVYQRSRGDMLEEEGKALMSRVIELELLLGNLKDGFRTRLANVEGQMLWEKERADWLAVLKHGTEGIVRQVHATVELLLEDLVADRDPSLVYANEDEEAETNATPITRSVRSSSLSSVDELEDDAEDENDTQLPHEGEVEVQNAQQTHTSRAGIQDRGSNRRTDTHTRSKKRERTHTQQQRQPPTPPKPEPVSRRTSKTKNTKSIGNSKSIGNGRGTHSRGGGDRKQRGGVKSYADSFRMRTALTTDLEEGDSGSACITEQLSVLVLETGDGAWDAEGSPIQSPNG